MQTKSSRLNFNTFAQQPKVSAMLGAAILIGAALASSTSVNAQDKLSLTGNAAVVSDYRYRGITQTTFKPAVQVGADLALPNGLYLGAWATNIKWIKDYGAIDFKNQGTVGIKGGTEVDIYGGYKAEITKGLVGDIGLLRYQYPGNSLVKHSGYDNANTTEVYGALSVGPATLKYSRSTTNLFGNIDSKGSGYLDLSASFDMGNGWTVSPHVGRQTIANSPAGNYVDISLGVTKDISGLLIGLTYITVDAKDEGFYQTFDGKFQGKSGVVLSAKYNF
jgi:uncharacterized protein (TIGR02001 family)